MITPVLPTYNRAPMAFVKGEGSWLTPVLRQDARIAVQGFPDESLDFVYIDSSHEFNETQDEILCWYPKLKSGGVLSGHDYANGPEVRRAVDLFAALNGLIVETTEKDDDLNFDFLITSWIIKKP